MQSHGEPSQAMTGRSLSYFPLQNRKFKGETFVSFKNYRTFVVAKEQRSSRHSRLVGAVASELA